MTEQEIKAAETEPSLYELYTGLFDCIVADSDELVDECYRLRYQVYCVEHPFKDPDPTEGEYERDEHDGHAIHALLRHRPTGEFIGTIRVILSDKESPQRMPVFMLAEEHHVFLPEVFYREPCAEISRFCISKGFRRRLTDGIYTTAYSPEEMASAPGRVIPFMALGLVAMAFRICRAHGITQSCAVMELSMIRLLSRLGIHFKPVGKAFEYYGTRQIAHITSDAMLASLAAERPDVMEIITDRGRFSFS